MRDLDESERARLLEVARLGLCAEVEWRYIESLLEVVLDDLQLVAAAVSIVHGSVHHVLASHALHAQPKWTRQLHEMDQPFVVDDGQFYPLMGDEASLVTLDGARSHIGVPLSGQQRGVVVVFGQGIRRFSAQDVQSLCDLADEISSILEPASQSGVRLRL